MAGRHGAQPSGITLCRGKFADDGTLRRLLQLSRRAFSANCLHSSYAGRGQTVVAMTACRDPGRAARVSDRKAELRASAIFGVPHPQRTSLTHISNAASEAGTDRRLVPIIVRFPLVRASNKVLDRPWHCHWRLSMQAPCSPMCTRACSV